MKTYSPKPGHIERRWYVIDAGGQVLGRVASEAAAILRGKHKPIYAPHMDTGDNVIIINASKVEITGNKDTKKFAYRHSGYPGGIKGTAYGKLMADKPAFVVEKAIRGMLPKNRLGRSMIAKLHVVPGPEHRHQAQKPVLYTLGRPPMWEGLPEPKQTRAAPATRKPAKAPTESSEPTAEFDAGTPAPESTGPSETAAKSTGKSPAKKPTARKTAAKSATKTPAKAKTTAKSTAKATAKSPAKKTPARKPAAKKEEE
jgi:large subunit ribosomal protein L13